MEAAADMTDSPEMKASNHAQSRRRIPQTEERTGVKLGEQKHEHPQGS